MEVYKIVKEKLTVVSYGEIINPETEGERK